MTRTESRPFTLPGYKQRSPLLVLLDESLQWQGHGRSELTPYLYISQLVSRKVSEYLTALAISFPHHIPYSHSLILGSSVVTYGLLLYTRILRWDQLPFALFFSQWPKQLPQCRNPISTALLRKAQTRPMTCSINIYRQHSRRTTLAFNRWPSILMATSGTTASGAVSLRLSSVSCPSVSEISHISRFTALVLNVPSMIILLTLPANRHDGLVLSLLPLRPNPISPEGYPRPRSLQRQCRRKWANSLPQPQSLTEIPSSAQPGVAYIS